MRYYTVYKTTNKLDGKFYIGKHETNDLEDGYLGSGKLLKRAIKKYGKENFEKIILHVFETEEEMNQKEKELVVINEMSYNRCEGGKGGWGYINRTISVDQKREAGRLGGAIGGKKKNLRLAAIMRERHRLGLVKYDKFTGKRHSEETKRQIGLSISIAKQTKREYSLLCA